jgi:hypothetical protein
MIYNNMKRIKTFDELFETHLEDSLEIQRHEFDETSWEYSWLLDGREVGEMMVFVDGENASIVSFFKQKGKATPRGCGYEFIKMCIDDLLKSGLAVHQADHTSNANSQEVWRNLANEYPVETTTWRGDPAKVIGKK